MPASTPLPPKRRLSSLMACAVVLAGCQSNLDISMPDVRGKSCQHYAAMIAELAGTVERKEIEMQAETAGFFAASVAMSLVIPFSGLATIPAEQAAKRDNYQAQSDLWSYKVAWNAKECQ